MILAKPHWTEVKTETKRYCQVSDMEYVQVSDMEYVQVSDTEYVQVSDTEYVQVVVESCWNHLVLHGWHH